MNSPLPQLTLPSDTAVPPAPTLLSESPETLFLNNGKLFRKTEHPLFVGFQQATDLHIITESNLHTRWKGSTLPYDLWCQICSFLRWTQTRHKAEAMLTFFYNQQTHEWAAWPFPQQPAGMTVRHLPNDPLYITDRARFGANWISIGTIHHHCTGAAFQSGTDKSDEENRDGVHITLGKMESPEMDIHVRQVFDGVLTVSPRLDDWFAGPDWYHPIPTAFRGDILRKLLTAPPATPYPPEWESRIMPLPNGHHGFPTPYGGSYPDPTRGGHQNFGSRKKKGRWQDTGRGDHRKDPRIDAWDLRMLNLIEEVLRDCEMTADRAHWLLSCDPNNISEQNFADLVELEAALKEKHVGSVAAKQLLEMNRPPPVF